MCGRYFLKVLEADLAEQLGSVDDTFDDHGDAPRFNIAPSQGVPIVRHRSESAQRHLTRVQWGLLPSFAKDRKLAWKLINARAETIDKTPSFRVAFARRRCLVPASGFFEWQKEGKRKLPHAIALKSGAVMTFAGLWEAWKDPETGAWLKSCTIITTAANDLMRTIHDRMPVILPAREHAAWLGEQPMEAAELKALLKPYPDDQLTMWPVSPAVNKPDHDSADNLVAWHEPRLIV